VDYDKLTSDRLAEHSSSTLKADARVQAARQRQLKRFKGTDIICNSDMRIAEVRKFCPVQKSGLSQVRRNWR